MAEEHREHHHPGSPEGVDLKDRGLLDYFRKNKEGETKTAPGEGEEEIVTKMGKAHVSEQDSKVDEPKEGEKKHESLLQKLHRPDSGSSSSSDEEGGEGKVGEKKKKKGLKDKMGVSGEKPAEDTSVAVERLQGETGPEEKKGFIEKIKGKFPGGGKNKGEEQPSPPSASPHPASPTGAASVGQEEERKKGIMEKIKEKIPGHHPKEEGGERH